MKIILYYVTINNIVYKLISNICNIAEYHNVVAILLESRRQSLAEILSYRLHDFI